MKREEKRERDDLNHRIKAKGLKALESDWLCGVQRRRDPKKADEIKRKKKKSKSEIRNYE